MELLPIFKAPCKSNQEQLHDLRLHARKIHKLSSSHAWTIHPFNPKQLLVFKAP